MHVQFCHLGSYFYYEYNIGKKTASFKITTFNDINIIVDFLEAKTESMSIPYLNMMWPNGVHITNVIFEEDPNVKCIKFKWINKSKGEYERYLFSTGTVVSISDSFLITVYHHNGTVYNVRKVSLEDDITEASQGIPVDKLAGGDVYSSYIDNDDGEDTITLEHLHFEKQLLKFLSKYIILDWKHFSVVTPDGTSSNNSNDVIPDTNHAIFSNNIFNYQKPSLVHLAEDALEMKWTDDTLSTKLSIEGEAMYFVTRLLSDRHLFDTQLVDMSHYDGGDGGQEMVGLIFVFLVSSLECVIGMETLHFEFMSMAKARAD